MSNQWINDLTVAELKQELRDRELKVSGIKAELLERLSEALAEEGSVGEAGEAATEKEKEKETTTRKKRSPGTPGAKASEFEKGAVKRGRGGGDYEVAVNKYGKKYWRKYTASEATTPTPTASTAATPEAVDEIEEWNKLVRKKMQQLKEMARVKDPDYEKTYGKLVKFQLIKFLLTGDPGPRPSKGISPKRKQVPVKPVPSKEKPKPSLKGKERVDAESEPEPGLESEIRRVGEFKEIALDEWTALGELDVLFSFLKEVEDAEQLFKLIQDGIDNTPKEQVKGSENIIRFEPDPNCDLSSGTCGAQALGILLESGVYSVSAEYTKANYLKSLYVDFGSGSGSGKRSELPTLADFGLLKNLVLADLFVLKAIVDRYDTVADLLEGMGGKSQIFDEKFVLLSNPIKAKRGHIMNVKFVTRAEGVYNGLYVHRSTDRRRN